VDDVNSYIGISNIFCAFLMILLSLPLKYGKIKMNKVYGVRIQKSFKSEKNGSASINTVLKEL